MENFEIRKYPQEKPEQKKHEFESFEDRFEREGFGGVDRVVVKGSVAMALMSGRNLELARDIDVFFIEGGFAPKMEVQSFGNLAQAKEKLPSSAFELIERFAAGHKLEHMPLQFVHISENLLREGSLFKNEPEAVLWDSNLELKKQILKPISESKKTGLLSKLNRLGKDLQVAEEIKKSVREAANLQLYKRGKLFNGEMPNFLRPSSERLSAALRLVDLGQRFGIPADDSFLMGKDIDARTGNIMLAFPAPAYKQEGGYERKFRVENTGAIDIAFYNIARKEGIKELLAREYPHLAAITRRIEEAGGLREFVKKEYGEVYLQRDYINLNVPSFSNSVFSEPEQIAVILNAWEFVPPTLFKDAKGFIKTCSELNKTYPITGYSPERLVETVFNLQIDSLLASKSAADREEAHRTMGFLLKKPGEDIKSCADREKLKAKMRAALSKERSARPREVLIKNFHQLADAGDLTILKDLADIVKKESTRLKIEKTARTSGETLSLEGMNALRIIFKFAHRDAKKAVLELMANPKIDKRIKKVCLKGLLEKDMLPDFTNIAAEDIKKDSRKIPWEDYAALLRVESIASSAVREQIRNLAAQAFLEIRRDHDNLSEVKNDIAPQLPWEFFLALHYLSGLKKAERIKPWEILISGVKSNKLRESFLYGIANISTRFFRLITEKIISAPEATKEHILLADRLIKKVNFLKAVEGNVREQDNIPAGKNLQTLLEEAKAPSLLEVKFDEKIVASLSELTERGDLTSGKIQSLFQAWENPEPFLLYIAGLANRSKIAPEYHHTILLTGEMLAHIDPQKMSDWKQWRYDRTNPVVAEQLRNLSDKQVESYASDEFVDLGEVLVGLLPSDKPDRIRQEIFHAINHDWPASGILESQAVTRFFLNTQSVIKQGKNFDMERVLTQDIDSLGLKMKIIKDWLDLREDERLAGGLAEQLISWRRNEAQKAKKLAELGYRGDESAQEINDIIARMKKSGENPKKISEIINLQPNALSMKIQGLLNRRNLPVSISPENIKTLQEDIRSDIEKIEEMQEFAALQEELFGKAESDPKAWQGAIKELKMAKLFLKLGRLSPQLIAFNKISPEKKKASLRSSIDSLKNHFAGKEMVAETLGRIQRIIDEENHSAGRDHLAVIFTDNPLAMLSIGKFPTGAESCQHYHNGDLLLGAYAADAYTKMMLLVDLDKLSSELLSELEKAKDSTSRLEVFRDNTESFLHASIGRRITKIVRDNETGRPQLFLEPVYTNINRESATRILNAFSIIHLKPKLEMDVVRGGGEEGVFVPESRNIFQYEDGEEGGPGGGGAGLGTKKGSYIMPAQKLTEADYLSAA